MNGPEHYRAAQELLAAATRLRARAEDRNDYTAVLDLDTAALAHATLAGVAAQVQPLLSVASPSGTRGANAVVDEWVRVVLGAVWQEDQAASVHYPPPSAR